MACLARVSAPGAGLLGAAGLLPPADGPGTDGVDSADGLPGGRDIMVVMVGWFLLAVRTFFFFRSEPLFMVVVMYDQVEERAEGEGEARQGWPAGRQGKSGKLGKLGKYEVSIVGLICKVLV